MEPAETGIDKQMLPRYPGACRVCGVQLAARQCPSSRGEGTVPLLLVAVAECHGEFLRPPAVSSSASKARMASASSSSGPRVPLVTG